MTPLEKLQDIHQGSYSDLDFDEFSNLYRQKFYADLSQEEFNSSLGIQPEKPEQPDEFAKQGEVGSDLSVEQDITEVDPFAMSEVGLDVGTDKARRATVRNVLQGATFNTADEIEAAFRSAFGDETYDENIDLIRNEMKAYAEARPGEALSQQVVGGFLNPAQIAKAPQYIQQLGTVKQAGIIGGVGGFGYGVGGAEGGVQERVEEGFVGAGAGLLLGASMQKLINVGSNTVLKRLVSDQNTAPTVDRLRQIKDEAYKAVDESGFVIGPGEAKTIFQRASDAAAKEQYITTQGSSTVVDRAQKLLESLTTKGMTLGQSETVRRRLFKLAEDQTDGYIVRKMISEFDDVIDEALGAVDSNALKIARSAHNSFKKAETVEQAFKGVDSKNTAQAYRKVAEKLLKSKDMKFFSAADKQMIQKMADGTLPTNVAQFIGKFSPTSNALMAALNVGVSVSNPWLLLLSIGTTGAKHIADKSAVKRAQNLIDKIGGIKKVRDMSTMDNPMTLSVAGISANEVRQELLGEPAPTTE